MSLCVRPAATLRNVTQPTAGTTPKRQGVVLRDPRTVLLFSCHRGNSPRDERKESK
ncbi:hypothetical protein CPT_Shaeky_057 [Streptomyces phage Shaeky]|uniref:Uncharacterized protein n=1 Tax=Streptomyces phage Shaeky TaxID=2767586 RepID=A0A873WVQ5_9CAUD|nr:hypothetical protein CPT_Shaeky_057 [Streptomyces phage Shaeky]